jgi:hypothetical protein
VRAEDKHCALGDFLDGFDENRPPPPQLIDDVAVVNDLVMYIDWPAVCFEGQFDDVDGSHNSGTEASGPNPYQRLRPIGTLNICKRQFTLRSLIVYPKRVVPATSSEGSGAKFGIEAYPRKRLFRAD